MSNNCLQNTHSNASSSLCIQTLKPNPNSLNRASRNSKVQIKYPVFKKKAEVPLQKTKNKEWKNSEQLITM
jgi:hypothetical protein